MYRADGLQIFVAVSQKPLRRKDVVLFRGSGIDKIYIPRDIGDGGLMDYMEYVNKSGISSSGGSKSSMKDE